tara:strand:- start:2581 stop:4230 length:1650 start_codon:yes stop_codon:yes gene_type:complete
VVDPNNNAADRFVTDLLNQQSELIVQQTRATRDLNGSILQASRELGTRFAAFVNPLKRFEDSLMRLDQTNRRALQMGVTTQKLRDAVSKNSDVINRGRVSNQKLIDAIQQNFGEGVRTQNESMLNLTEEMIATGQNTAGLTQMNSDLLLFTGDNIKALDRANKANKQISDKYGVTNEKLINSVNSLRDTFEQASFFGPDTTASLTELSQELKARTGGKAVEGSIRTLFSLFTGGMDTLDPAMRLGADRSLLGGEIGMGDVTGVLQRLADIADQSGGGNLGLGADIAAMRTGLQKQQVNQLLALHEQLKQNYELDSNVAATEDDRFNSLQNINDRARNFYDNTAIESLGVLGKIDTNLLILGSNMAMTFGILKGFMPTAGGGAGIGAGIGGRMGMIGSFLKGRGGGALLAGGGAALLAGTDNNEAGTTGGFLSNILTGASMGAMGGGLIGAGIGAVGGLVYSFFEDTADASKKTAENTGEQLKIAQQQQREEQRRRAALEVERVSVLANYVRSRLDPRVGAETVRLLSQQVQSLERMRKENNRNGTTVTR